MNKSNDKQKLFIIILAIVCVALVVVCVAMLSCGGSGETAVEDEEFVYNPGETGLDENGNTIIVDSDDSTEQMDSIPNGIEGQVSPSDTE